MKKSKAVDETKPQKPFIYQKDKLAAPLKIREFPWSEKQEKFIALLEDKSTKVVICKGPAGTAKTMLSVYTSLKALNSQKIGEIIYIRNPVESSSFSLGFLKGGLEDKLAPYLQPLMDKLHELISESDINRLIKEERIIGTPVGFLRGTTFNVNYVIVDEAQNLKYEDLLLIMTRLGKFSKLILCGDTMQSDIHSSAFESVFKLFNDECSLEKGIHTFEFGLEDIFRNEILSYIIEKFSTLSKKTQKG